MSETNTNGSYFLALFFVLGMSGLGATAQAETDLKFSDYIKQIKVGGDFRIRYGDEHYKKGTAADRSRFSTRLRLNADFQLPNNVAIKTALASGTGDQTSTNQTMTGMSSQKQIWVDKAYIDWTPTDYLNMRAGRMALPLWTVYTTDAVWDSDVNPEGFSQGFNYLVGGRVNLFLNALQMVTVERSGDTRDGYMFAEQIGSEFRLPLESRLKLAYTYYDWKNTAESNFGQNKIQEGNRRQTVGTSANTLVNPFGVNEVSAELASWVGAVPFSLQGTFLKNARVKGEYAEKEDTGYQTGLIVGKAKDAQSWELAYFYKYVQTDATVADISASDFGGGGINRMGHIMWAAYSPTEWLNLKTKYFITKNIEKNIAGATGDINRIQVDAQVKF